MKNKIKIPIAEPCLGKEELDNIVEAVKSGWISSKGKFIKQFEDKFAEYCGRKHGIATSNGTAALHLALAVLGIKKGDEVILPTLTFAATANAVIYCNAKPVFIDSHPGYWCIDPEKIERKITKKTKAIIPVHLYGHPCDMDLIMKIAKKYNLYVIEDCAEAHGAEYRGKKVGSFGDISCFSFFGNKIITTGEGGMCLTNNKELADKMRILRNQGMSPGKKYWHDMIGFNYRITNLQAAIGVAQIKKLDKFIEKKRKIVRKYTSGLKDLNSISFRQEMPWAKPVCWLYSVLIEDKFGVSRDELMKRLEKEGIETRPFFHLMHKMPPYKTKQNLTKAENISSKGISFPSSVDLTGKEIEYIIKTLKNLAVVKS